MGYGAMRITGPGIWGPPADKAATLTTLLRTVELHVNLIDTADSYGPKVSEELIAEALYPYPAGLVIATKGGRERPGPGQWTHNASPKHLTEALEGSLKRLRVDRIDIHQLHAPDNAVSFEASVEALAKLREQGKIRHVALSNVTREHIERSPGLRSVRPKKHIRPSKKWRMSFTLPRCRWRWCGWSSVQSDCAYPWNFFGYAPRRKHRSCGSGTSSVGI
jgi:aryl-alcohol dehydrogenase-like predicted oxidoreductase